MPRYDFECPKKNCTFHRLDVFFRLRDFLEYIFDFCPIHGHGWFKLILSSPVVEDWGNNQEGRYFEHTSHPGNIFYSKQQFKRYLKENQLREYNAYD